jgi:hypothetical protein
MKVTETKDTMVCEAMEPSEKAMAICDAISNACKENDVAPSEIFPVLGEALIRVLVNCAGVLGYDEVSYVHCFGKGLATCELEFKEHIEG